MADTHQGVYIARLEARIATLTRERDEAIARAELLKNGWHQFIAALEGEISGIEWKTKAEIDDATTWTNFGSIAEQIYAYAIEDARNYDREFADTAEKERDEQRQRADRAEAQLAEARREVELLRAMLRSLQWSITRQEGNTYWAHCPRCLKRMDHGHADDCPLAAALNPPAEGQDS